MWKRFVTYLGRPAFMPHVTIFEVFLFILFIQILDRFADWVLR